MDPYVVEFLRGNLSREIDQELYKEQLTRRDGIDAALRSGKMEHARYNMGICDGLLLAISVLDKIRGDEDNAPKTYPEDSFGEV